MLLEAPVAHALSMMYAYVKEVGRLYACGYTACRDDSS